MRRRAHRSALTAEQVEHYHREGYVGPFTAFSPDEMAVVRRRIETDLLGTWNQWPGAQYQTRHLDNRTVYDVCTHPQILDRIESIVGPDLVLWQSNFFMKEPGDGEYPWHQDSNYWPIEPQINVSAWVAIDPATRENGCVQLIPRSHRQQVPHVAAQAERAFPEQADPTMIDVDKAVDMVLAPGQFFLFSERMLHHSNANHSPHRRMGLAVRVIVPIVRCYAEHPVIVVRGRDRMGFNRTTQPPKSAVGRLARAVDTLRARASRMLSSSASSRSA